MELKELLIEDSKCVETALHLLPMAGIKVFLYLNNLLLLTQSREEVETQTSTLVLQLSLLVFTINWE